MPDGLVTYFQVIVFMYAFLKKRKKNKKESILGK